MTITLSPNVLTLDGRALEPGGAVGGTSFDLGDGRVVYALGITAAVSSLPAGGRFTVVDLSDGASLVAPRPVDPDTALAPARTGDTSFTGVFAATPLDDGGVRLHFTQSASLTPGGGTQIQYFRDFDVAGNATGPSTVVDSTAPFFLAENTVPLLLSNGDIALAHDRGVTVLGPDGSLRGGFDGRLPSFATDEGYAPIEVGGRLLVISTQPGGAPGAGAPIRGQFFTLDGAVSGTAFDIVSETVVPPLSNYDGGTTRLDAALLDGGTIALVYADGSAESSNPLDAAALQGGLTGLILGADGRPAGPSFLVNASETRARQTEPVVFALNDGGFVVAYDDDSFADGDRVGARVQRFAADGTPEGQAAFIRQISLSLIPGDGVNTVIRPDGTGLLIDQIGLVRTIDVAGLAPLPSFQPPVEPPVEPISIPPEAPPTATPPTEPPTATPPTEPPTATPPTEPPTLTPPVPPVEPRVSDPPGTEGPDRLIGTALEDFIDGLGGNDTILGLEGGDVLEGGPGDDVIEGGPGNDILDGGIGADTMRGGGDSDMYVVDDGGDRVEDSGGFDTIFTSVDFDLAGTGAEALVGQGSQGLRLRGTQADERLQGTDQGDILIGLGGRDRFEGGAGADVFVFAASPDGSESFVAGFSGRAEGGEGDRIAIDDQLLGIGSAGIDIRGIDIGTIFDLFAAGVVGLDRAGYTLSFDADADGTAEFTALFGSDVVEPVAADVFIF